ncbi:MAG TPA: Mur ligase family protein, partial [Kofleriaceae bacterium]|nr:Mur ligase family protein [Kofleriaceae bacterium]
MTEMTEYEALLRRLLPARRFGVDLGLGRIRVLLDRLGAPDRRMGTIVHVGGTNGKGSTVAMIAALAGTHGRVAAYTSPHLSSLRERIAIDGAPIDEGAICAAADAVRAAGGDALTFFEQLTAIACVAIADARVAVTVLEVGLGGRLDATNAIDAPVAVVTGVAMDHEAILGGTLERIAAEKAGVFKRGQRVVIGASG